MYVSITRAKHDVSIYTDDKKQMINQAIEEQPKGSTLDYTEPAYYKVKKKIEPAVDKETPKKQLLAKESIDESPFQKSFKKKIDVKRKEKGKEIDKGMDIDF